MKRTLLLALFAGLFTILFGMASENRCLALDQNASTQAQAQKPAQPSGSDFLVAEMSLKTWLGIAESERVKIARDFVDDYYRMDKGCSFAKIKAFYHEKEGLASIYVECLKRTKPLKQDNQPSPMGT